MNRFYLLVLSLTLATMIFSCAREVSGDSDQTEKDYLTSYNAVYGPYEQTTSGLYYILREPGTGSISPQDGQFAFVRYTAYSMNGAIIETTSDTLTKQLGSYSDSLYFGPRIKSFGTNSLYAGWDEVLKGMTDGGHTKFIMPSWLSYYYKGGSRAYSSPIITDMQMVEVVPDIAQWQTDTLENFSNKYFSGLDSTAFNFYCTVNSTDTANTSDTMKISYVGYLLDGFVFDTNIADSAVKHGIYNSSKTYGPMTVIKSEMSFVEGFKKALNQMENGSKAHTFFSSDYGYKTQQQGQIQPYSPLHFYIDLKIGKVKSDTTSTNP